MQNAFGGQFLVLRAEWHLTDVVVTYRADDCNGTLDHGLVTIDTPAHYAAELKKKAGNSGGGL
jgi:hypothetical protein